MKDNNIKEELVQEFHEAFDHPVSSKIHIIPEERMQFRINMMQEELDELKEAVALEDPVEMLDALCDLQYFLSGTVVELGMKSIFGKAFREVHDSNMSKLCYSVVEAKDTVELYQEARGVETFFHKQGDYWVVKRKEDGKILKSINWRKPRLDKIIQTRINGEG